MGKVNSQTSLFDNFDESNIDFISKPFERDDGVNTAQEYTLVQENAPCEVKPSILGMEKSINLLLN